MGATSLPYFRADMYEFGEREVPRHGNRKPPSHAGNTWGLMGILAPNLKDRPTVIATNVTSSDTLLLLADARLRQFEKEYGVEVTGNEVRFLTPADGAHALSADKGGNSGMSVEIANGETTLQLLERAGQLPVAGTASPVMERIISAGISLVPATAAPEALAA